MAQVRITPSHISSTVIHGQPSHNSSVLAIPSLRSLTWAIISSIRMFSIWIQNMISSHHPLGDWVHVTVSAVLLGKYLRLDDDGLRFVFALNNPVKALV